MKISRGWYERRRVQGTIHSKRDVYRLWFVALVVIPLSISLLVRVFLPAQ